jgi:hypothetical protein
MEFSAFPLSRSHRDHSKEKKMCCLPYCSFRALDLTGFAGLIMKPRRINTMGTMVPIKYTLA